MRHQRTRPYRPQSNGNVERFNRTLLEEWAYPAAVALQRHPRPRLAAWVHRYNMHRAHTALDGRPPISRFNNFPRYST